MPVRCVGIEHYWSRITVQRNIARLTVNDYGFALELPSNTSFTSELQLRSSVPQTTKVASIGKEFVEATIFLGMKIIRPNGTHYEWNVMYCTNVRAGSILVHSRESVPCDVSHARARMCVCVHVCTYQRKEIVVQYQRY